MTLQRIKDEIHNIKIIDLPFHSSGEDYDQLKTAIDRLENIVNKYKPPTCDTCGYCNQVVKFGYTEFQCENYDVVNDPAVEGFGCNQHSDYERKE